jgi:ATP phosphoribosyltransferase regulatory subunit
MRAQHTEPPNAIEALEAQGQRIMETFLEAGYEYVAPPIMQPADVYLDVVGEVLRSRTFVFTDPDGIELCLRPDLTVPACRLFLARYPKAKATARFAYRGPVFRYQPGREDPARPREFRQAGLESFGAADKAEADVEVVRLTLEALHGAGLKSFRLRFGDLGIFRALLSGLSMPDRWRARLLHAFWQPEEFKRLLKKLATDPARAPKSLPRSLIGRIDPSRPREAEDIVAAHLAAEGIPHIGSRSIAEIAEHVVHIAEDARAEPLAAATADAIEDYLAVAGPTPSAGAKIRRVAKRAGLDLEQPAAAFEHRLALLAKAGVAVKSSQFSAGFGWNFEYYTGLVFQAVVEGLGKGGEIAGGGRYDGLLRAAGSPRDVPAVGAAIHTERLLTIVRGQRL